MRYPRLVEPNAGSILVDGLDVLNEVHLQTLRAGLAIVPQVCNIILLFDIRIILRSLVNVF